MSSEQERERIRHWGPAEDFAVSLVLMTLLALVLFLAEEVWSDMGAEDAESIAFSFHVLGSLVIYLMITAVGDAMELLFCSLETYTSTSADIPRALLWGGFGVGYFYLQRNPKFDSGQLEEAAIIWAAFFALLLISRAIPDFVKGRMESWVKGVVSRAA